jgi:hypothetical protein
MAVTATLTRKKMKDVSDGTVRAMVWSALVFVFWVVVFVAVFDVVVNVDSLSDEEQEDCDNEDEGGRNSTVEESFDSFIY